MGMSWGARLNWGDGINWWGCALGACDTGLIREMGLIHWGGWGGVGGGGWGVGVGARDTGRIRAMGLIHGGSPWAHGTLAGSGRRD